MNKSTVMKLLSGPILFLLVLLLVPESVMPYAVRGALGLFLWMAAWWITLPVGVAVTSLLPILICAVFGIVAVGDIIPQYFSDLVVLLLGANILTLTWETTGLNRRIALRALSLVGPSIKSQLAVWFIASTVMSIFLPNVVVGATLTPIALAMLKAVKKENPGEHLSAANILLAIAWGSGIGGFGSPLGGGMNLVVIGYIEELTGMEYMYTTWVKLMIPILIVITIGNVLYMLTMKSETKMLPGAKEYFVAEYNKLGKMNRSEAISLTLFVIPVVMAFTRQLWMGLIPSLGSSYVFIVFAIIAFCVPGECNGKLITWKYAQPKISWGLFYTLAGGLALGKVITTSGASNMVADFVANSGITNAALLCVIFIVMASVLANISSNNSACAIACPLVVSVMTALNQNPIPYLYMAAVGGNLAYLLPSATRAIPVDAGVEPSYMLKKGALVNVIAVVLAILCALVCIKLPMYS
ncbi:SLC13 family permease [Roseburia hominis]